MRECKEKLKSVHSRRASRLDFVTGKSSKVAHVWSMQGSWRVTSAVALQDKTSSLARQLARDSFQSWGRVARTSCLLETWLFTFHTHPTINILIPTKCRELLERIFREKNKINSSHPLHWYILERYISQNPYLIIPISMRKLFGAWEAVQKEPIHFGWCNGLLWDPVS